MAALDYTFLCLIKRVIPDCAVIKSNVDISDSYTYHLDIELFLTYLQEV